MILTGKQIQNLAFAAGLSIDKEQADSALECEITIAQGDNGDLIAYIADYPEEGCVNLDD